MSHLIKILCCLQIQLFSSLVVKELIAQMNSLIEEKLLCLLYIFSLYSVVKQAFPFQSNPNNLNSS